MGWAIRCYCRLKEEAELCRMSMATQSKKLETLESAYEEHERLKEQVERTTALHASKLETSNCQYFFQSSLLCTSFHNALIFRNLDFFTQMCMHILKEYYSTTTRTIPTYAYIVGKEISSRIYTYWRHFFLKSRDTIIIYSKWLKIYWPNSVSYTSSKDNKKTNSHTRITIAYSETTVKLTYNSICWR